MNVIVHVITPDADYWSDPVPVANLQLIHDEEVGNLVVVFYRDQSNPTKGSHKWIFPKGGWTGVRTITPSEKKSTE